MVKITNLNMEKVMQNMLKEVFSEAFFYVFLPEEEQPTEEEIKSKIVEIFKENLKEDDIKNKTSVVDVKLNLIEGQWKINQSDDLLNAITGGMITFVDSMNSAIEDVNEGL